MSDQSTALWDARERALKALAADASLGELQTVAADLGSALVAAADSDAWGTVAEGRARSLTQDERRRLAEALDLDWVALLNQLGYRPPPQVETFGLAFGDAARDALVASQDVDVSGVRENVRLLGAGLLALSERPGTSRGRLRRWIRRGIRVAGPVALFAAAAAGTVALAHPVGIGLAAVLKALNIVLPEAVKEFIREVVASGAVELIKKAGERVWPDGRDEAQVDHDLDAAANGSLTDVSDVAVGELFHEWLAAAGGSASEPELQQRSLRFALRALRDVSGSWDAALGATWWSDDLGSRFDTLTGRLVTLRRSLDAAAPEPFTVASELNGVYDEIVALQERMRDATGVARQDPLAEVRDAATAASERVAAVAARLEATKEVCRHLDVALKLQRLKAKPKPRMGKPPHLPDKSSDAHIAEAERKLGLCRALSTAVGESLSRTRERAAELARVAGRRAS